LTNKEKCATIEQLVTKYCAKTEQDEWLRRVRRRIEDHLRKSHGEVIIKVALYLNIKTD
jgi:hypothetical protein